VALAFFMSGAVLGGWMTRTMNPQDPGSTPVHALAVETILLWVASAVSVGFRAPYEDNKLKIAFVIALTAVVMGLRNAVVRKLGVPDLTTTVLTLTIRWVCCRLKPCGRQQPAVGETRRGHFGDADRGDRRHFDAHLFRGGTAVRLRRHNRDLRAGATAP
jgi:Protein of unknown function (DUF1275)